MLAKKLEGAAAAAVPAYIEDVFSTWLYTGNDSTQTITNGIDLAGNGGLVWIKSRSATTNHFLFDTLRGTTDELNTNTTDAEASLANSLTAFNVDGFSIGSATGIGVNAATYASWTFRKQPKFFDVVTWSGNDVAGRQIPHNLGSTPGFIIVKKTSIVSNWTVWHRSVPSNNGLLNTTDPINFAGYIYSPTSTDFRVFAAETNESGVTYVAYLFAHDAGGFGLSGTDNVISCGSFTTDGSGNATVNLGYEPQWLMYKRSSDTSDWQMFDNMRGFTVAGQNDAMLRANTSGAEVSVSAVHPTATGFGVTGEYVSSTWIYIAIRRGPMKTPTNGTSVFVPTLGSNTGLAPGFITGFPVDSVLSRNKGTTFNTQVDDRLRGARYLFTNTTGAEGSSSDAKFDLMNGVNTAKSSNNIGWCFRRAPGFFDEVCYTGTGSTLTLQHNLAQTPNLALFKNRSGAWDWIVVYQTETTNNTMSLNQTSGNFGIQLGDPSSYVVSWNASQMVLGPASGNLEQTNLAGDNYVTYLFASCPGVSKVGTYTGSGTTKQIDCGFTGGARFVLIKRTDSTGDWYVWDSARGIVAGNDPYLLLNSTAAEVTSTDYIDTYSAGFEISSTAPAAINANGGTFIFLAVA